MATMMIMPFARLMATIERLPDGMLPLSRHGEPFPDDVLVLLLVSANGLLTFAVLFEVFGSNLPVLFWAAVAIVYLPRRAARKNPKTRHEAKRRPLPLKGQHNAGVHKGLSH